MDQELLTIKEVAELLRLSERTVSDKIRAGLIPAVRIGATLRVRREALQEIIKGGKP